MRSRAFGAFASRCEGCFNGVMASAPDDAADPRPEPPARPLAADCCRGGCDPCVFDLYEEELARYEESLRRWRLRNPRV